MCTLLEFVSGEERGREEDIFLTFIASHMWVLFFSLTREKLREEITKVGAGRGEGGRREGGEGGIISAERLGHYPLQTIPLCHFFSNHTGWLWI